MFLTEQMKKCIIEESKSNLVNKQKNDISQKKLAHALTHLSFCFVAHRINCCPNERTIIYLNSQQKQHFVI